MNLRSASLILILLSTVLLNSGCLFKSSPYKGVMSYRSQKVYLQGGGYYQVGKLSEDWQPMSSSDKAISFYNKAYSSSITTDAFCQTKSTDRPLEILAQELASALADRKTISEQEFMLNDRGALRRLVTGNIDGVDMNMDIVVLKKNNCSFDFVAVIPPVNMDQVRREFENFFGGFEYQ